ncbi:MAG: Bug family tripartite tricarboxylate transporter substrate binding protein [Xanthobacteraceae bacterium]
MHGIELAVRALAVTLLGALVLSPALSAGQPWPQRTVRLIVPLPPGIPTDLVCRLFADRLSERWRQPVVVENRQGSDGIPAVSGFVSARDEHTLLCSFPGIVTINPLIYEKLPYDPLLLACWLQAQAGTHLASAHL